MLGIDQKVVLDQALELMVKEGFSIETIAEIGQLAPTEPYLMDEVERWLEFKLGNAIGSPAEHNKALMDELRVARPFAKDAAVLIPFEPFSMSQEEFEAVKARTQRVIEEVRSGLSELERTKAELQRWQDWSRAIHVGLGWIKKDGYLDDAEGRARIEHALERRD